MVGLGYGSYEFLKNFDVIDLGTPSSKCMAIPEYPLALYGATAGLGLDEKPIVCGGYSSRSKFESECYTLSTSWQNVTLLSQGIVRGQFAPLVLPLASNFQNFFLSGGENENGLTSKTEMLTSQGWEEIPSNGTTDPVRDYCMILLNSTSLIKIGGENSVGVKSRNTFILHSWSKKWTQGPSLLTARSEMSCSRIR